MGIVTSLQFLTESCLIQEQGSTKIAENDKLDEHKLKVT